MAESHTYGFAEMRRYLQHKMSQQEMHDFEKALMNDPFLADAFEGFSAGDTTVAETHLQAIERSLTTQQREAKVVPLPGDKMQWWKIAAVALLVISASVIGYWMVIHPAKEQQQLAIKTTKPAIKDTLVTEEKPLAIQEKTPAKTEFKKMSIPPSASHVKADQPIAYQKRSAKAVDISERSIVKEEPAIAQAAPAAVPEKKDIDSIAKKQEARTVMGYSAQRKAEANEVRSTPNENIFKGRVVDKSGDPLPFATVTANDHAIKTTTDANGRFNLRSPDSVLNVNVTSTGYTSARAKIASGAKENNITLKESDLSLSEIVVANLAKKKTTSFLVQLDTTIAAEPVGGWKNFKQYLNHRFEDLTLQDGGQNEAEEVVINFSIDQQGKPTDIKTPPATDKLIADKAAEIISHGPLWKKRKKDEKVKVIIIPKENF